MPFASRFRGGATIIAAPPAASGRHRFMLDMSNATPLNTQGAYVHARTGRAFVIDPIRMRPPQKLHVS